MVGQLDLFEEVYDALSMDTASRQVYETIRVHLGRNQAIQVDDISERTGIPERSVRHAVKHLIEHHRVRIGSAPRPPAGYYMIETDEEAEDNERTLRRLALSTLSHAAAIRRLTIAEYMKRLQGEMFPSTTLRERLSDRAGAGNGIRERIEI